MYEEKLQRIHFHNYVVFSYILLAQFAIRVWEYFCTKTLHFFLPVWVKQDVCVFVIQSGLNIGLKKMQFPWKQTVSLILPHSMLRADLKSDNLQYNTLVRWANGTNDSSNKHLTFQVFFFIISYRLMALKTLYFHFFNFIKK